MNNTEKILDYISKEYPTLTTEQGLYVKEIIAACNGLSFTFNGDKISDEKIKAIIGIVKSLINISMVKE